MNLTVQHALPPMVDKISCEHCDEFIDKDEYKYVKLFFGKTKYEFHEDCFVSILTALNRFDEMFLQDDQGSERVH